MSAVFGWALAAAALFIGWRGYGWQGLAFAFTLVVFWLLLQFNRGVRVMRDASESPVGWVQSAVMFNAKLHRGMSLMQIVKLARSLGRRVSERPEVWQWSDDGGSTVAVTVVDGRCTEWALQRPDADAAADRAGDAGDAGSTPPAPEAPRLGADTLPPAG
jgi:uncharacterized protein (DUF58 family)